MLHMHLTKDQVYFFLLGFGFGIVATCVRIACAT